MPFVAAELAGDRGLAGERRLPWSASAGGAVGRQAHALDLDRDVGDHERDRLAVADRLAEGLALVDVRDHVVEHCLGGADRHRAPGDRGRRRTHSA